MYGRIVEEGSPSDIFDHPNDERPKDFWYLANKGFLLIYKNRLNIIFNSYYLIGE